MQFGHLAEMETINGKCDRQRKQARTAEQGPEEEPSIVDAFDAADAQLIDGTSQGQDKLLIQVDSHHDGCSSRRNVNTRSKRCRGIKGKQAGFSCLPPPKFIYLCFVFYSSLMMDLVCRLC
jgi:hypothetical protein